MAYQTYITDALVCGSYDRGNADRLYVLFTREAGMVYAHAQSVRREYSKQRYALQICSHIRATLIRGRHEWKIAGAESRQNLYATCATREERAFVRDLIVLLRRCVQGESPHPALYDEVMEVCAVLDKHHPNPLKQIMELRMLYALGYVAPHDAYASLLTPAFPYHHVASLSTEVEQHIATTIEHALMQSQL